MKLLIFALLSAFLLPSPAFAQWVTQLDDDAFSSNKNVLMIGQAGPYHGLAIDCSADGTVSVASIEEDQATELAEPLGGMLLVVKSDDGFSWEQAALLARRNANYVQVIAINPPEVRELVEAIGQAKAKVVVGVDIIGSRHSMNYSASGSTKAAERFLDACSALQDTDAQD